ncbi:MAG: hypothetical protein Q9M19_00165 [Mariprofundaceae bacterium]|nr:hypothetical protein [Mariprofundaceae bacterium]
MFTVLVDGTRAKPYQVNAIRVLFDANRLHVSSPLAALHFRFKDHDIMLNPQYIQRGHFALVEIGQPTLVVSVNNFFFDIILGKVH